MATRTTGSFDSGGERIYYESIGDGEPVVLCHGLGGNHACWWRVLPTLAEHHRVVTWDQRGFGNSSRRTGLYGPEPSVEDLAGLVDHLGLESVQLVGQSMGGWVAMGLALRQRGRVGSLVLTDTLAGVFTDAVNAEVQKTIGRVLERSGPLGGDELGRHRALGESFCRDHPDLAFCYQEISSMGDKPDDAEVFKMLGAMRVPLDQVNALDLPVLLVVGDDDLLCPPAAMRLIAAQLPNAELRVIQGAGHSPYFEQPALWAEIVGTFLRRHGPRRDGG